MERGQDGERERGNGTRRGEATAGKGDRWRGKVKGKQENMEKEEKRGKTTGKGEMTETGNGEMGHDREREKDGER